MSEQNKPFVVVDRRRHTMEGDLRPDADPSPAKPPREVSEPPAPSGPVAVEAAPAQAEEETYTSELDTEGQEIPQGPSPEQMEHARLAYTQTAERLTLAVRAANPGMEHPPAMSFDGVIQSVYMSAIMQLGGGTPEGQQPQVDIMGAQQSIEMLDVLKAKSEGNRSEAESALIERALFELQVAFLEITQALARSAAAKQQQAAQQGPGGFGPPTPGGRPSIVR